VQVASWDIAAVILTYSNTTLAVMRGHWWPLALVIILLAGLRSELPAELSAGCQAGWAVVQNQPFYTEVPAYHGSPLVAIVLAPVGQPPQRGLAWVPVTLVLLAWLGLCLLAWLVCWYFVSGMDRPLQTWVVLLPLGTSLWLGSPDILIMALLLASTHERIHHRSSGAGLLLAAAATLHPICLLLLLQCVVKPDRLYLHATLLGLFLTLLLLPALVFGLEGVSLLNRHYLRNCWSITGALPIVLMLFWQGWSIARTRSRIAT
jgi:hypothetical protein